MGSLDASSLGAMILNAMCVPILEKELNSFCQLALG